MSWIFSFYRSALAKKAVMAVTGVMLFGFVLGHMLGNLKLYLGQAKLDHYAEGLRELGAPFFGPGQFLWLARIGLLVAVALHIHAATSLTLLARKARPVSYAVLSPQTTTYASRTMRWGGVIILLFVIFHLLDLTVGVRAIHPGFESGQVFHNVVTSFQNPLVSGFYVLANLALGFHLYHGLWSFFQSLGWSGPRLNVFRQRFAAVFAILICAVNISFPVAVLTGLVNLGG